MAPELLNFIKKDEHSFKVNDLNVKFNLGKSTC